MQIEDSGSFSTNLKRFQEPPHEIFSYSKYIDNGFFITQKKKQFLVCLTIQFANERIKAMISVLKHKHMLDHAILSTLSMQISNIYDKILISKMNNHYFVSYYILNYTCWIALYRVHNKKLKNISKMRFSNYAIKVNEDAICFLSTQFRCAFVPGAGSLHLLDLKSRKKLDIFNSITAVESIKYNTKDKILAVKSIEEIYLLKIIDDFKFSPILFRIKVDEPFAGIPSAPDIPLVIAKFKDLKAYAFDEENQRLFVIFAWIMVDSRLVAPRISHLRIQKWKVGEKYTLEHVQDIEWNQNRSQKFKIIPKLEQCVATGKRAIIFDLNGNIVKEVNDKIELLSIHQNDVLYFCKSIPEV